jgi:hypothetical protein
MADEDLKPLDPQLELEAMGVIAKALGPLGSTAKLRVLRWALDLYGREGATPTGAGPTGPLDSQAAWPSTATRKVTEYSEFGEFYSAARPSTDAEKALVAAAWSQLKEGAQEIDTQAVNTRLKHLGYPIGNITRAFDALKDARPSLVIQLKKMGNSQQARKRYKVTTEGQKEVERMLSSAA